MRTVPSRTTHPHRQTSRRDKRARRHVKREFLSARSELVRISLAAYEEFDHRSPVALATIAPAMLRYRTALWNYTAVFGEVAS